MGSGHVLLIMIAVAGGERREAQSNEASRNHVVDCGPRTTFYYALDFAEGKVSRYLSKEMRQAYKHFLLHVQTAKALYHCQVMALTDL